MFHEAEQFPLLMPQTLPNVDIATPKKHHRYGPSRMGYLDECAGFTSRSGTNDAAEEGTALHERMEAILQLVIKGTAKTACQGLNIYTTNHDLADDERDYLRFCCVRCDVYIV